MSANGELRDRAIRHAIALGRYSRGTADAIVRLLNEVDDELTQRIAAGVSGIEERGFFLSPTDRKRMQKLQEELKAINATAYGDVRDKLVDELSQLAGAESDFQKSSLDGTLGSTDLTALPAPRLLATIATTTPIEGSLLAEWFDGMEAARLQRIGAAIVKGMTMGEGTDAIVRRVKGTKARNYQDGVLDISRRSAQTLVRTAVTTVSNTAAQATWRANQDIIRGWQFCATLDNRTTITCASLDGQVFDVGQGPVPPLHLGCRSITVAVTKTFRDMDVDADEIPAGKRASMDGQVAAGTTFHTWLKGKNAATQDQVLGKTRAQLFRTGKLDLKQFIKNDGTVLTLDQLRKAHGDILV